MAPGIPHEATDPQATPPEREQQTRLGSASLGTFQTTLVPGHKDGVVQEVLEDFAVLSLLLLGLLLGLGFRAGAARPLLSAAHFGLGVLGHLLDVNGAIGILPDGDFVCSGDRRPTRAEMKAKSQTPVAASACNGERGRLCWAVQTAGARLRVPPTSALTFGAIVVPVKVAVLRLPLPPHDVVT